MAIANTTTWANVIREVYSPGRLVSTAFFNRTLFDLAGYPDLGDAAAPGYAVPKGLFPVIPSNGGNSYNWTVIQTTGAAETYSESEAAPAPGSNTLLSAQAAYSDGYFQRTVEISGHAMDQIKGEGGIIDAFQRELDAAVASIVDLVNTTAMGSTMLQLAVDSAGIYAGIDRGTYGNWGSYEKAVSGAMSRAALDDMVEALQDNDRGASLSDLIILCPVNQLTNHGSLAGVASSTSTIPIMAASGGNLDLGFVSHSHQGIPMVGIPDMTDTEVYCLHRPSVKWVMQRPLTLKELPQQGDSMRWLLTLALILVVERPHLCGKLTGVTA